MSKPTRNLTTQANRRYWNLVDQVAGEAKIASRVLSLDQLDPWDDPRELSCSLVYRSEDA